VREALGRGVVEAQVGRAASQSALSLASSAPTPSALDRLAARDYRGNFREPAHRFPGPGTSSQRWREAQSQPDAALALQRRRARSRSRPIRPASRAASARPRSTSQPRLDQRCLEPCTQQDQPTATLGEKRRALRGPRAARGAVASHPPRGVVDRLGPRCRDPVFSEARP
jgi:hypothetical protein